MNVFVIIFPINKSYKKYLIFNTGALNSKTLGASTTATYFVFFFTSPNIEWTPFDTDSFLLKILRNKVLIIAIVMLL